jgi:hypothetical protein
MAFSCQGIQSAIPMMIEGGVVADSFGNKLKIDKKQLIFWGVAFIPLAVYVLTIFSYSVNIPFYDDFDFILSFLNTKKATFPLGDQLTLMLKRETDHIPFFPKLLFAIDLAINGTINFYHLIVLGNICLAALAILIYKCYSAKPETKIRTFIPILFILFQLQYWEIPTWPGAAVVFFTTIFFGLFALYLLKRGEGIYFAAAAGMSTIAAFTGGNGFFILISGMGFLFEQRRIKDLIYWSIFSFILFCFYGYIYSSQGTDSLAALVSQITQHPLRFLIYYWAATGSAAGLGIEYLSIAFGFIFFCWFVYLTHKKYFKQNPIIYHFMVFLMLTAFVVASKKSSLGIDIILFTSRYRLISILLMATVAVSLFELFNHGLPEKVFFKYIQAYIIILFVLSYILYLPFISGRYHEVKTGINGLLHNDPPRAYDILQASIRNHIYEPPKMYLENINPHYKRSAEDKLNNFMNRFNQRSNDDTTLTLRLNWNKTDWFKTKLHILLQKPEVIFLFNSGLTPTSIREILHKVNPDTYQGKIIIQNDPHSADKQPKDSINVK